MKKLINLLKGFLQKGPSEVEQRNQKYFEEKIKAMKVELLSDKSSCGCGGTCQCANGSKKLEKAKADLKKPVNPKPKTVAKKPAAKPATAKKPAPKKPKAE